MICARCGAQNPDGNAFCQACGVQLTAMQGPPSAAPGAPGVSPPAPAAAPVGGPPAGLPPPSFSGPAGYASPYYVPQAAMPPVHRTPWMLIVGVVLALVVLMAGCGTALAVLGSRGAVSINGSVGSNDVPSPSPAGTPSPVASPPPTPATGPSTASNDGVTVTIPAGWTVESKDDEEIVLSDPDSVGIVDVASGSSNPAESAQDDVTTVDDEFKNRYPDTKNCPNTKTVASTLNGVKGYSWTLCFTVTDSAHPVAIAASMFVGANASGSVYYAVFVMSQQADITHYMTVARPVVASVHWKLS